MGSKAGLGGIAAGLGKDTAQTICSKGYSVIDVVIDSSNIS